jgi:manganese/zinc/iron transport system ATP- binding protein
MSHPLFPYGSRVHRDPVADADALVTEDLSIGYPGSRRPVVQDLSLRVPRGTRVALVGPNGAGKSTLLKAVAGLLPIFSGQVRIYGNPVGACHHRVAYLPQRGEIDWRFPISLRRLVMTGRYVHLGWLRWPGNRDGEIVEGVLERLGLCELAERQIGRLSGGQQQRALLARALAQEADLLLLDEPLNAVDAETRDVVHVVLSELQKRGKTVIAATHDLGRLAENFDAAVYLNEGRLVTPLDGAFTGIRLGKERAWTG